MVDSDDSVVTFDNCMQHGCYTVETPIVSVPYWGQWLHSDVVVIVDNCKQNGDYTVDQLYIVTMLPVVYISDYTITV